jgi:hypothetical protein
MGTIMAEQNLGSLKNLPTNVKRTRQARMTVKY